MKLQHLRVKALNAVGILLLSLLLNSGCAGYYAPVEEDYVERDSQGIPLPQFIGDNPCDEQGYESQACKRYMHYLSYQKDNEGGCFVRTIEDEDGVLVKESVCRD